MRHLKQPDLNYTEQGSNRIRLKINVHASAELSITDEIAYTPTVLFATQGK